VKLIRQITAWPEELCDSYTGVVFIYYKTGYEEIVNVNVCDYTMPNVENF